MAIEVRNIWKAGKDLPQFRIQKGDEVIELADGRLIIRSCIERSDLSEKIPGLRPLDPDDPDMMEMIELQEAIRRYYLGWRPRVKGE